MAHSCIVSFEKEEDAFKEFSRVFPPAFLLVDAYDSIVIKKDNQIRDSYKWLNC